MELIPVLVDFFLLLIFLVAWSHFFPSLFSNRLYSILSVFLGRTDVLSIYNIPKSNICLARTEIIYAVRLHSIHIIREIGVGDGSWWNILTYLTGLLGNIKKISSLKCTWPDFDTFSEILSPLFVNELQPGQGTQILVSIFSFICTLRGLLGRPRIIETSSI